MENSLVDEFQQQSLLPIHPFTEINYPPEEHTNIVLITSFQALKGHTNRFLFYTLVDTSMSHPQSPHLEGRK